MEKNHPTLPRPLERGLNSLKYLSKQEGGATLSDISRAIDSPKSSLLTVLHALVAMGYAAYDGKRYSVGRQATELAADIMGNNSLFHVAEPVLQALASETGENVALGRFDPKKKVLVYTHKVEGSHPIRFTMEVGDERDLYSSNGGRVILAHQTDDWVRHYLKETPLRAYTQFTLVSPVDIQKEIESIRLTGVAHSIEEMFEGGAGFSAPIYDATGTLLSVLVITSVAPRARRNKNTLQQKARQAAAEISARLGYKPVA